MENTGGIDSKMSQYLVKNLAKNSHLTFLLLQQRVVCSLHDFYVCLKLLFLKQISAILGSASYRYKETSVTSTAKNQAKKEPPLL